MYKARVYAGFQTARHQPVAGDRVTWDGDGWYFARPGKVVNQHGSTVRRVSFWRRQVGPHAVGATMRHFDELSRLLAWPQSHLDDNGDFAEGVVVDYTHDWECYRSPRARLEHQRMSAYLGSDWNRPHRVEREFVPVTEITEPEPEQWPAWADAE